MWQPWTRYAIHYERSRGGWHSHPLVSCLNPSYRRHLLTSSRTTDWTLYCKLLLTSLALCSELLFIDSLLLLFQLHHLFEDSKEILVCINGFVLCITFVYFKMRQKNSNFTSQKQVSLLTANILQNSQTYYTIHLHPEEWTGMRNFCCNESLSLTKLPAVEI